MKWTFVPNDPIGIIIMYVKQHWTIWATKTVEDCSLFTQMFARRKMRSTGWLYNVRSDDFQLEMFWWLEPCNSDTNTMLFAKVDGNVLTKYMSGLSVIVKNKARNCPRDQY